MKKAIIFDLDGVIVSTDKFHYQSWKHIADKLNIHFDKEINNRLRGVSRMDSLNIILENSKERFTEKEKIDFTEQKNNYYRALLETLGPDDVVPIVLSTLKTLKTMGLKLAIGSSSKNAKMILKQIGLFSFFDAISDGTNVSKSKPDPEVFIKAANFLDIDPKYCVVVEDAVAGVKAARTANMQCIAIGDATKTNIADYNIESFDEILNIMNFYNHEIKVGYDK